MARPHRTSARDPRLERGPAGYAEVMTFDVRAA
jgi:hypothetical protein